MRAMTMSLHIAVAQINPTVGDLAGNADRLIGAIEKAREAGADILLAPELALAGYPPEDLLLRPDFYFSCEREFARVVAAGEGLTVVIGHPLREEDGRCYNAASVVRDGAVLARCRKQALPNYSVFDEQRYFTAGEGFCVFEQDGVRLGVAICEDLWQTGPARAAHEAGAQALLGLNASPFHVNKRLQRLDEMRARVTEHQLPMLYCNLVGGQDELVFDGASFALDADGRVGWRAPSWEEHIGLVELVGEGWRATESAPEPEADAEVYAALVTGVRDYVGKNGFPEAIIGFSGGIDSALALAIAVDALGADKVRTVMMPSPYTMQMSLDDARDMAQRLGVRYDEIAIEPAMKVFAELLEEQLRGLPEDTTEENLQSRIRGMILMALSNKTGAIVLTTGNKSEMATGYATLYGDMAGGFAVLKDLYKCAVYRLSNWRNTVSEVIPQNIIDRPPSAELKPNQLDQDSLPPYEILDAIIEGYMERDELPRDMIARGLPEEAVRRVVRLLRLNEYKRRQAPVGTRVTSRGFGRDWRYPITSHYRDEF